MPDAKSPRNDQQSDQQIYRPELDKLFPVRDPGDPTRIHPAYADENDLSRCASAVTIRDVDFDGQEVEDDLFAALQNNFPGNRYAHASGKQDFLRDLKASCIAELQATLDGKFPPSSSVISIVVIEPAHCDSEQEAAALVGQYGGLLRDYRPDRQPTLENGTILCIYAGSRLESKSDFKKFERRFGLEFGAHILAKFGTRVLKSGQMTSNITWSPFDGGNLGQFFNTTLTPENTIDPDRCNASFIQINIDLTDKNGQPRQEQLYAWVLHRLVEPGRQIRANYGPGYVVD